MCIGFIVFLCCVVFIAGYFAIDHFNRQSDFKEFYNNYELSSDASVASIENDFVQQDTVYSVEVKEDDSNYYLLLLQDNPRFGAPKVTDSRTLSKGIE